MECHCRLNACLSSAPSEGEKEREYEREKIRERRGRREREHILDPFVMGDMRMSEREGTMVVELKDGEGGKGGPVD